MKTLNELLNQVQREMDAMAVTLRDMPAGFTAARLDDGENVLLISRKKGKWQLTSFYADGKHGGIQVSI